MPLPNTAVASSLDQSNGPPNPAATAPVLANIQVGQHSCAGKKPENQDSMAARLPTGAEATIKGAAFAVADGISSSDISQIAAETAVKAVVNDYYATPQAWTAKSSAARVIQATNSWLFAQNRHQRISDMNHGMVCTLSALILKAQEAHIFHVGDSRVSRLLANGLEPLTQDHTTQLSESVQYLGRALGAHHQVDIDYQVVPLSPGDIFLLTTDGVHEFIDADAVQQAIDAHPDLNDAAQQVTSLALERGSPDNLTVQIVRVNALPQPALPGTSPDARLPIPRSLAPGDVLDGFTLLREIHHTNRSQLMLAVDAAGKRAALKIPSIEASQDPDYLQRFLYEEWIANRIHSAHVVEALETPAPRSASYVALAWIEGQTLRQWMIDHPNPEIDRVRNIAEQVARGLRALHRQEMIHQDLRPENVMLDENGTAIIIDLGSVAVAGLEQAVPGSSGALPGTFQYTAPEYLSGDQVSWRSDQYALGVLVYEMLTGQLPYGAQVARVRNRRDQQALKYKPADLGEQPQPEWVDFALARACHRDPTRRYDALSEFLADLRSPSQSYKPRATRPLLERNPMRFWQGVALLQTLIILFLIAGG